MVEKEVFGRVAGHRLTFTVGCAAPKSEERKRRPERMKAVVFMAELVDVLNRCA